MASNPAVEAAIQRAKDQARAKDELAKGTASGTAVDIRKAAIFKPVVAPLKILTSEEMVAGLMTAPTVVEVHQDAHEKVLVFGPPFAGKSTLAALLSEYFHVLWFDGDNSVSVIKNNLPLELQKRIIFVPIPANTATPIFLNTMLKVVTGRQVDVCTAHGAINCPACKKEDPKITVALNSLPGNWVVVMDNMTQFVVCAYATSILKANPKEKDTPVDYKMEFDDWGMVKNIVDKFGAYVKDGKFNFVLLSHEAMVKQEDAKTKLVAVAGSDPSSRTFAKNFGHEVFCQIANGKHHYASSTTFNNQIQTGSRSNVALEKEKTPSLLHFFKTAEAAKLLEGSFTEWFFSDRSKPAPKPKEILPT